MKTYAVVYRFADGKAAQAFKKATLDSFSNIRERNTDLFHYIGFAGGTDPEIADKLAGILRNIQYSASIGDEDYVGMYFTPEDNQDEITRQMAFGKDETIESDITPNYRPEHVSIITDLLDYNPVRDEQV